MSFLHCKATIPLGMLCSRAPLYGHGPHFVFIDGQFTAAGTLLLNLGVNSSDRVWSGVLRGPGGS